jgi:hypothetical protein
VLPPAFAGFKLPSLVRASFDPQNEQDNPRLNIKTAVSKTVII